MVKTIFTGHTLDLRSILAIGPLMQKNDPIYKFLFIKITLKGGAVIEHNFDYESNPRRDSNEWNKYFDSAMDQRSKLVNEWIAANKGFSLRII